MNILSILLSIPSIYTMMVMSGAKVNNPGCQPEGLAELVVPALVDSAIAIGLDIVIITGDLTRNGQQQEIDDVALEIQRLGQANIPVVVMPGENEDNDEFAEAFAGLSDAYSQRREDPQSHSFIMQPAPRLSLIGIKATLDTVWKLPTSTLEWITAQADSATNAGDRVIALSHFPIVEPADFLSDLDHLVMIDNYREVLDSMYMHNIMFVISGNYPVLNMSRALYPDGRYVAEISAASPVIYPCTFRLITISDSLSTFDCETRYIQSLPNHPNLYNESKAWIEPKIGEVIAPAIIETYWEQRDTLDQMIDDMEVEPLVETVLGLFAGGKKGLKTLVNDLLNAMPTTPEGRAEYINSYFGEDLGKAGLIHLGGNEGEQESEEIVDHVYTQAKAMIYDLIDKAYPEWYQFAKRGELKAAVATAIPIIKQIEAIQRIYYSFFGDYTRYGKDNQDRTDDISASFSFARLPYIDDGGGTTGQFEIINNLMPRKILKDGQLLIEREGQLYTTTGAKYVL